MGIPASQRLRKQCEFQSVRKSEHRIHCGAFISQCEFGDEEAGAAPMLGVIASRRVGNAVKRNRGKRLVREIFRLHAGALPRGSRFVIVLRSGYDQYSFGDLETHFMKACQRILSRAHSGKISQ